MAYDPIAFDHSTYDVVQADIHKYTWHPDYWKPLRQVVEIYDNTGRTLLLSYDSFNPESNTVKLLDCSVTLGLTNTSFRLRFEDGHGIIDQNTIGLGNKVLVYGGRNSNDLTLLFTGYAEDRTPIIIGDNVMDYEIVGVGENATLNDIIVNFKRASSSLVDIDDPNFPKRPDSKMVVFELVKDLFEDPDVRATRDIILKDYLGIDITGISPLVTERLLSIVQNMQEVSQVLNFLCEVTGAYWKIENGKLYFEYPDIQHSGITIKNKPENTDLADTTSYFESGAQWRYTDSISKSNGFANRVYTTTAVDTKSVANAMKNHGATALFDRAIAQQVTLTETRLNTLTFILSKIGDPFTELPDDQQIESDRGGTPNNPPPPPPTCPTGYHLDTATNQCVPDSPTNPPTCPTGYHWDTNSQQCVLNNPPSGGGGEGQLDTYGIEWLISTGQQFLIEQSRDEATDDRWSGNVTGLRQGAEATMITKSIGVAGGGEAHVAMKIGGGNHSGSGASSQRWYDIGWRDNGELQLQWEGPHPNNHDFTLPDTKCFIRNLGFGLEGRWLGLKWAVTTVTPNSTPANGGVRVRHWIDRDPIGTDGKPKNNWELVLDFIDGVDVQVIDPQTYAMPDEWDCEVRKSDTNSHEVYQGGLHVRRLGTSSSSFMRKSDVDNTLAKQKSLMKARKPPRVSDPTKTVGKPCKPFDCPRNIKQIMIQRPESVTFAAENNIIQSAPPVTNPEQNVDGEIRIDIDNKPIGPVICQFKVNVGGLSSTADTIFVNDIKIDASVLSPTAKYWIVLLPCGTSYRNTILWHHDGDLVTKDRYSAFAKGRTRSTLSEFQVSNYGPTYTHAVFARLRRIQEYSDPQSIQKFRLKEDIVEADYLDDSVSVAKLMQNVLAIRGKPVRRYEINEVTLPLDKWFTPGQNVTIIDDTGHHEEDKNIFAEIQEVTYSWSTSQADSTIGIFRVRVLPVGHLNWHKEQFPSGD